MFQHLKEIAAKETIEIDDDAIFAICSAVAGGMRDAQAKLDQLSLYPVRITKALIYENLGRVSESMLKELALKIIGDNPSEIVGAVGEILNAGKEPIIVIQDLANFYMNLLLYKTSGILDPAYSEDDFDVEIYEDQIKENISKLKGSEWTIKTTNQSKLWLEVTLVGLSGNSSQPATQQKVVTSVLPLEQRIKIANRHKDLSDEIGWETIYIGRGTPFGNEYEVGVYGTADECVKAFKSSSWIKFKDEASDFRVAINDLLARLRAGSKIRLMCSCSNVCHGEVVRSLLIWAHKNV
jgi:DNA polymerase-3 subunit gamma/tau